MGKYDTVIIGGGFYGLRIAQHLREELGQKRVLVLEKADDLMMRASYNNQARVHNGYHYPRSVLTALRSRVNLPRFSSEFEHAIMKDLTKYYAVARRFSKVSARQYLRFFERIGAEIAVDDEGTQFFNPRMIEEVFKVQEFVFDTTEIKKMMLNRLAPLGVEIFTGESVESVKPNLDNLSVETSLGLYEANWVINTTYASINSINQTSGLPIIPLKHELTEMCLVKVPDVIKSTAFTVMCGPFFSLMPFPPKNLFTLSHVRYTPHSEWHDRVTGLTGQDSIINEYAPKSHFPQMLADLKRYMPEVASKLSYSGESLWEIKTVLPQSEEDDSRPILYREHHGGLKNYICLMGGKIDNVYDVLRELDISYGKTS